MNYTIPLLPLKVSLETPRALKKLSIAHHALAELKDIANNFPDQNTLLSLLLQEEAKDRLPIENIISTYAGAENVISTYSDIENIISTYSPIENIISTYNEHVSSIHTPQRFASGHAKEAHHYALALDQGYSQVKKTGQLTNAHILEMHALIVENTAGFRKFPGTELKKEKTRQTVYVPPQESKQIQALMDNLEQFINDEALSAYDPLIKMAMIHHQILSIHPFYDGNGRIGRMVSVLYLVKQQLLNSPILYLSRYINQNKNAYYNHLQAVRENHAWEEWVLYMLEAIIQTSAHTTHFIQTMDAFMQKPHIQCAAI